MAFVAPQGNKTVMVDSSNNIVYPASFQKVVATQATIAGNNFTSVPSVIDPENATTTQLPSVASVVSYVSDVVEGGSSGLIPAIQSDIQTLGQVKSNRGEFWFECGALTTTNKMPLNTPFSCVWTMSMTQEEFILHKTYYPKIIGNIGYWSDTGYGWCINRIGDTLIGVGANNVGGSGQDFKTLDVKNYLDGNPHIWSVVYNGTNISLYIDNVKKTSLAFTFESSEATNPLGIGSTPTSTYQNYGVWGKIYRIKYFNFDMSADDAPYTIDDYIAGKDESPLLYGGAYNFNSKSDWLAFHSNEGTFASTGNDLTFTASEDSTAGYLVFYVNANVKAGTKVEALIDSVVNNTSATISKYSISAGATSTNDAGSSPSSTTLFGTQTSFTTTKDSNKLAFWIWKTGTFATGETLTLVNPQIRVDGALLSLDDYSIKVGATQIIPDVSSNNNDATIAGVVYGSKDTSIAKMAQLFYQSQQG